MTYKVNSLLAKLLAKEDITVQHGNYSTAWFDVKNRILGLPNWKNMGKDVYDMLVGHEVGHALYTPESGFHNNNEEVKGCPKSYLNIIEDARIERFIQRDYPGLVSCFSKAYTTLFHDGIFGEITPEEVPSKALIDRINLKAKLGSRLEVPFSDEEEVLFNRAMTSQTWSEVCDIVRDIVALEDKNEQEDSPEPTSGEDTSSDGEGIDTGNSQEDHDDNGDQLQDSGDYDMESADNEDDDKAADQSMTDEDLDQRKEDDTDSQDSFGGDGTEGTGTTTESQETKDRKAETDEEFRNNEKDLIDVDEQGNMVYTFEDYNKEEVNQIVVPYSKLRDLRKSTLADLHSSQRPEYTLNLLGDLTKIKMKEISKSIQPAVREFETKKAAYEYQRSSTSNRGTVDVDKLFSYRYNEDIFSSITVKADAKNHGMFMLLDLSGSMYNILPEVIDQTLSLIAFCKATAIPFKLYGFTTGHNQHTPKRHNVPDTMGCSLIELANSELNKKQYEEALTYLLIKGLCVHNLTSNLNKYKSEHAQTILREIDSITRLGYLSNLQAKVEGLGATPFSQALLVSRQLMIDFKAKHRIQKLNLITLCDGDAVDLGTAFYYNDDERSDVEVKSSDGINYDTRTVKLKVGRDIITTDCRLYSRTNGTPDIKTRDRKLASKIIKSLRKQIGLSTQGFFVADTNSAFNYRVIGSYHDADSSLLWDPVTNDTIKKKASKEYRKSKCVEILNTHGYDNYFIVKGGDSLSIDSEFSVDKDAKAGQIKNAFVKYSKGKKTNKVLLEKFARSIC